MGSWADGLLLVLVGVGLTGCSVSVRAGHGDPQAEQIYVSAMRGPSDALMAASSAAEDVCAGGPHENPSVCYANTEKEISAVQALQAALGSVPTPERFASGNTDLLKGLDLMTQGLTQRNRGLVDKSADEYLAGVDTINRSLDLQKTALAKFPPDARISG